MARPTYRLATRDADGPPHSARVIVADDDNEMCRLVAEALRSDGHLVIEVCDGALLLAGLAEALDAERESWDLIVSDVRMPGFSGLDLLVALRASDCLTPVILMTAFPDQFAKLQAEKLGATMLGKPFELEVLRDAATRILSQERRATVAAFGHAAPE